ncbi:MAG TPA: hypothetical protein VGX23_33760 [Actinocrinis sp.]|nr:hypothetical protein [Actinocrinis sp.]
MTEQTAQIAAYSRHAEPLIPARYAKEHPSPAFTASCPTWCVGGHGPRFAHTGLATGLFDVVTQLRMHRGEATVSITLDSPRNTGVTLDAEELRRGIDHLATCRDRLVAAQYADES